MSQADYTFTGAEGGPALTAEFNEMFSAGQTKNSGASAPTTTFSFQWYVETGGAEPVVKMRNEANDGYVSPGDLTWDIFGSSVDLDAGTAVGDLVQIVDVGGGAAGLPAIDGSNLTGISGGNGSVPDLAPPLELRYWQENSDISANNWLATEYNGTDSFVAVGQGGTIAQSSDGETWTDVVTSLSTNILADVAWIGGAANRFVAVSPNATNRSYVSSDGISWGSSATADDGSQWSAVASNDDGDLMVAVASSTATYNFMYSSDGLSWTGVTFETGTAWTDVIWAETLSLWVAVGIGGTYQVATSSNGISWTGRTAAETNSWQSIAYSPELGLFLACASDGANRFMTSEDGLSWTAVSAPSASWWNTVVWVSELRSFIAFAGNGDNLIATSLNGNDWQSQVTVDIDFTGAVYASDQQRLVVVADENTGNPSITSYIVGSGTGSALPVTDDTAIVKGSVDDSKLLRFEVDAFSTATTRVWTMPNVDVIVTQFAATILDDSTSNEMKTTLSLDNVENTALSTWSGATSITTVGTIATGTWEGDTITVANGGTGVATMTAYSIVCGGTTSTGALQNVSGVGTTGQVLTSNGAGALPTWQAAGGGSSLPVDDTTSLVQDPVDNTKQMRVDVGAVTTGTTRTLTMPDEDVEVVTATTYTATLLDDTTSAEARATLEIDLTSVPVSTQSGSTYTAALSDAGTAILFTNAVVVELTIPTNASVAFPIGSFLWAVQQGTGQVVFGGAGVTINNTYGHDATFGQYSVVKIIKTGTDEWTTSGQTGFHTFSEVALALNPVRYYRLGDLSGSPAADLGSDATSGTYNGTPTYGDITTPIPDGDKAVSFGTGDYVTASITGVKFERTDPWSVFYMLKTSATGAVMGVGNLASASPNPGWEVSLNVGKVLVYLINNVSSNSIQVSSSVSVNTGSWVSVAATYDGSSTAAGTKIYINGVEDTSTTVNADTLSASITGTSSDLNISARNGTLTAAQVLDEVIIYDYELTSQNISQLHALTGI